MKTVGIVCEYNPFHNGHALQFQKIRTLLGSDTAIVCVMSGNFVQRGYPAVFDKSLRAEAALRCGANLVLELPIPVSLSSAEGFAAGSVRILNGLCDTLCFGAENPERSVFHSVAQALLSPDFPPLLKAALSAGCSFPAARQAALEQMGVPAAVLEKPNNPLGAEYCKAILAQEANMDILPVIREGAYHDTAPQQAYPSATAVRSLLEAGKDACPFLPDAAAVVFENAAVHTLKAGERAMLARLRSMTDEEFESLPYGSEGLWRKLMHACREQPDLESVLTAAKSKRYTRSRLDRMVMCAFLGLTAEDMLSPAPYARILGFDDIGRTILRRSRGAVPLRNAGETIPGNYQELEKKAGSLYGLFAAGSPEPPDLEAKRRIIYIGG